MSLSYLLRSQVASFVLFLIFVAGAPSLLAATPMIAAGWSHTIALKSDGTVVAWGDNGDGQLGNGTTTASVTPAVVGGLSNVVAVAAGRYHSAALKSDGTVMTWGANTNGQLGNGSTTRSTTPQAVPELTGVIAVAAGNSHTVALKSDGTLMAWGDNTNGQLGDGAALSAPSTSAPTTTTTTTTTSTKPGSLPPTYTPAIVKQPVVEPIARNPKPVAVVGLSEVVAIAAGGAHTVALKSDGTVRAWGNNNSGELGNGTTTDSSRPNVVPGLTGVVALAASSVGYYTVALKSDGTVAAWGSNRSGQLGNGATTQILTPQVVTALERVVALSAAAEQVLALKSDSTAMAWGANNFGQLGNGVISSPITTPTAIPRLAGVVALGVGTSNAVALKSDGTVLTWGFAVTSAEVPTALPALNLGPQPIPALPGISLTRASTAGVSIAITPLPWKVGQSFPVYLGALAGGNLYLRGPGIREWQLFKGGTMPVVQQVTAMPSSLPMDVLDLDISALTGIEIYAAYGMPTELGHAAKILTVQKRVTILYTDPTSPVFFSTYSPLGQTVVGRRSASGGLDTLDVVDPDGTYYQLLLGEPGLSGIKIGGYEISIVATDASGNVTSVSVKDSSGVFQRSSRANVAGAASSSPPSQRTNKSCPSDRLLNLVCELSSIGATGTMLVGDEAVWNIGSKADRAWRLGVAIVKKAGDWLSGKDPHETFFDAEDSVKKVTQQARDIQTTSLDQINESAGIYVYPDVPSQTGTAEEIARRIAADTAKVARKDYELATMNARTLTAPNGDWSNPVACMSAYAPIKNVCVPVIRSVTPTAVMVNQSANFVATGDDLTDGMKFFMSNCAPLDATSSGNFTRQQATCTPAKVGTFDGSWSMAKTGHPVFNGSIQVCPSTQVVTSGKCACIATQELVNGLCVDKCKTTEIRQNGKCILKPVICANSEEVVNNVCLAKCGASEIRKNGVCVKSCPAGTELWSGICFDPSKMECPTAIQTCSTYVPVTGGASTTTCKSSSVPSSCQGGGSTSGGSSGTGTTSPPATNVGPSIVGIWYWTERCSTENDSGSATFEQNGYFSEYSSSAGFESGKWVLSGNNLILKYDLNRSPYSGTISGINSTSFTFNVSSVPTLVRRGCVTV